ncbi:hypothetical protein K7G98_40400, partial [Saccharothrix sp. MB29]|nr:hypothetical protein [Saccharothrix sp. MB29]
LASSGVPLTHAQAWLMVRVFRQSVAHGAATLDRLAADTRVPPGVFEPVARQLQTRGYLVETADQYRFTSAGTAVFAEGSTAMAELDTL